MPVPRVRTTSSEGAHALQSIRGMPRKQRFKPSRKPQQNQATVSNPQVDDRREIHRDDSSIERDASDREATRDIERDVR